MPYYLLGYNYVSKPDYSADKSELLNIIMYNLNKIRAHIKMLELEQLKLTRYADEATRIVKRDPQRERDIARALTRVTANITMYEAKLKAFENAVPDAPPRDPINGSGLGGPLV